MRNGAVAVPGGTLDPVVTVYVRDFCANNPIGAAVGTTSRVYLAGKLVGAWYVPGRLFSVNDATARIVPGLFARNERVILELEGARGPFVLVLVGALFVGSMATVWHGDVLPRRARRIVALPVEPSAPPLERGAELGRFNMGSTVIVLLPPGAGRWDPAMAAARTLRLGERVGVLGATAPAAPIGRR